MSKETAKKVLDSRLLMIKGWDKKDALSLMFPQRVEAGKVYNFKDQVIMSHDGEDCVFHEDSDVIDTVTRVTDKFLTDFYTPIDAYFSGEPELDDEVMEDVTDEKAGKKAKKAKKEKVDETKDEAEQPTESDGKLIASVKEFIEAGDLKAAKKLLKKNEDHVDYKKAKKILKKAGN